MYAIIRIAERTGLLKRTIYSAYNADQERYDKKAEGRDYHNVTDKENLKEKIPGKDIFAAGILMTALTLPYLWFIMPVYLDMSWYPVNGEIIVAFVESLIIWYMLKIRLYQAVIIAIIVNSVSYGLGLFI